MSIIFQILFISRTQFSCYKIFIVFRSIHRTSSSSATMLLWMCSAQLTRHLDLGTMKYGRARRRVPIWSSSIMTIWFMQKSFPKLKRICVESLTRWCDMNSTCCRYGNGLDTKSDFTVHIDYEVCTMKDGNDSNLTFLQIALDKDRAAKGKKVKKSGKKARRAGKKGKKKKEKDLTPDRTTESLFEELVVNGIIVKYPEFYLKDYLGDRAYAARLPTNPAPGDIRQVIKEYCILPQGSPIIRNYAPCIKALLICGPKGTGKRSLAYAVATETGSVMFDLSPANLAGKYPGKTGLIMLLHLVQKVSRLLQPAVLYFEDAEKPFMKKIPKTDRTDPKRLKKDLQKIVKNIAPEDRVILIGISNAPWVKICVYSWHSSRVEFCSREWNPEFFMLKFFSFYIFTQCVVARSLVNFPSKIESLIWKFRIFNSKNTHRLRASSSVYLKRNFITKIFPFFFFMFQHHHHRFAGSRSETFTTNLRSHPVHPSSGLWSAFVRLAWIIIVINFTFQLSTFHFSWIIKQFFYFNSFHSISRHSTLDSQYSGVSKHFDYGAMAKVSDGYTIGSVVSCIREVITCKRMLQLRVKPLTHVELINAIRYHSMEQANSIHFLLLPDDYWHWLPRHFSSCFFLLFSSSHIMCL